MPPSPRLFARSTRVTYLSETMIVSAQKIADTPPMTLTGVERDPVLRAEGLLGRVQRARADVAVDDAEREQGERRGRLLAVGRTGRRLRRAGFCDRIHRRAAYRVRGSRSQAIAIIYGKFTPFLR